MTSTLRLTIAVLIAPALAAAGPDIPPRPEDIEFDAMQFEPPVAAEFRHELAAGIPVYLAPSGEFPIIKLSFTFKGGDYLAPNGVGPATGEMMRRGGTMSVSAEDLDERLDFLAAIASTSVGETSSRASLNCLTSNFEEGLALFMDMVRQPGFQSDRFELYRQEVLERMKQRNDDAGGILSREWAAMLYGRDHYLGRLPTASDIESLTTTDLRELHARIFHPGNLIISVSGDFEPVAMTARLESALTGWDAGPRAPDPPEPAVTLQPGVYQIEKDIPQGKVNIGCRGIARDDPDAFAMMLMNEILGGGGFTSRITKRVRSDEGLAYTARSASAPEVYFPGEFRAFFQSKSSTVALATQIIIEEIESIRTVAVSDDELQTAKSSIIETFPRRFESRENRLAVFVTDELTGRAPGYWQTYRDRVQAVTAADILDVARRRIDPQRMAIFVVGDWEAIAPGDMEGRASMSALFGGHVTHLPLRDPLTLEPME